MSEQFYRIENGLVVNGSITADNVPGALSDLTDVDLSGEQQDGDSLVWDESANKWMPGAVDAGASAWIYVEETGPSDQMPSLVYTQSRVGIGTNGDQSSDYYFVVNGDTLLSDVKISGTSLIGNGTYSDLGEIKLVPNESLVAQGQYVYIRPTANLDQTHIHIEAGNVDLADLYLGDDDRYVKIDHTGPVKIGVPGASTTSNWTADSDATGTTYISIALATYPWAIDLTIGDTVTLPDDSSVTVSNAYFGSGYAYVTVDSPITYTTSDVLEFTYQPRSEWSFNPDSSAEFPGDLAATSFIGDGSELTGITLAGLADVDTTTSPPSTGQGLLWDGLTSKWRPGNVPQGEPGADALWNFTGAYNAGLPYAVGDVATYNGETWYRIDAHGGNVGDTPLEGTFWTKLASKGDQGDPGDRYATTSTSTLTIASNGTITFTTDDLGLDYSYGQTLIIAHDLANHMHGEVSSYNPVTGQLTVVLKSKTGSGTYSTWSINLDGAVTNMVGSVVQVVSASTTSLNTTTSTSFVTSSLSVTITPSSPSHRVFVIATCMFFVEDTTVGEGLYATITRNGTNLGNSTYGMTATGTSGVGESGSMSFYDSPVPGSNTYTVSFRSRLGGTVSVVNGTANEGKVATITAFEVPQ
jgi:hypothetical protein